MASQSEVMNRLLSDRRLFIETLMRVEDKNRELVPLHLNPIQSDMHETSTGRDVTVKPAQVGGTTFVMCDFLVDCLTIIGTTAVIISYDEFITGRLLRKAQSLYDNLALVPGLIIPKLHHKSTSEKTYIHEDSRGIKRGESSFYIASAKGFAMPRGEPIHDLLMDELAFWPEGAAEDVFAAALQRVPLLPTTKVRVISTPNGEDNDFYELYMAAKEGREVGKSIFKAHFYEWYRHPEYLLPLDSPFVLPGDDVHELRNLDEDEKMLLIRFAALGMTETEAYARLRWRRYKIAEMSSLKRSGETALLFGQEYPEDDVSCFQSAGDMWYDHEQINDMAKGCYDAPYHSHFADIWVLPEDGQTYLLSADPGLGKKSMSVAEVWKFLGDSIVHCATLAGLYENPEFGEKCKTLARFYGRTTIAAEDALGFIAHIADYPDLYYRTDPDTGIISKNIGWQTNTSTKPFMCNEVSRMLPNIDCHDVRIIGQCRNIKGIKSRGRLRPVSVGADDFHDSMAIAIVCRAAIPIERGFVGAKGWTW